MYDGDGGQLYRTSYASFTLHSGEVVNVGYLHVGAWREGRSSFGRPVEVEVDVTDWPVASSTASRPSARTSTRR